MQTAPTLTQVLSYKRRLMLILSLLLSFAFVLTTLGSYWTSKDSIRESILTHELPLTSVNIYFEIRKELTRPLLISSTMAANSFLNEWLVNGESDPEKITHFLSEIKRRYGFVTAFFASDATKNYYSATGLRKRIDENDPDDAWYFRAKALNDDYEINLDRDDGVHGKLTLFVNYQVRDAEQNVLGVTGVGVTVASLRALIDDYQRRFQRTIYFVDSTGAVVVSADGKGLQGKNTRDLPGLGAISETIKTAKEGTYEYTVDGKVHLLNVRLISELNWYLYTEKVEDISLHGIRNTLAVNLVICALITVVVLLLTHLTINHYQHRLEVFATSDHLTGLANREVFDVVSAQALKEMHRSGNPISALMFDIDHFKRVNDTRGHPAGDTVLKGVAQAAKLSLRHSDILCRWGGEEFMVILKNCDAANALALGEKLRQAIKAAPLQHEGVAVPVTVSVGTATLATGETIAHLTTRADTAMYEAKNSGRDRVCQG